MAQMNNGIHKTTISILGNTTRLGVHADATVHVKNLQVLNPKGYCVSGYEPASIIHVQHVKMIDDRGGDQNNSDGFIGANGSSLRDVYFDLGDDTIKLYRDMTIEDVEINMQHNGAPIQIGWNDDNNGDVTATIKNLKITGNQEDGYNLAVFSWVNENHTKTVDLTIDGLYVEVPEAALFKLSPPNATANFTFNNANILTAIYGAVAPRVAILLLMTQPSKQITTATMASSPNLRLRNKDHLLIKRLLMKAHQ